MDAAVCAAALHPGRQGSRHAEGASCALAGRAFPVPLTICQEGALFFGVEFAEPLPCADPPHPGTDLLEDALQVSAILAFSAAPGAAAAGAPAWSALVGAASTVNQLKWGLVTPISGSLVLLAGGALAAAWRPHANGKDV